MSDLRHWRIDEADGIGALTLDVAERPVNVLSGEVLEELGECLKDLAGRKLKGLVVRSGKGGFIAGADVTEVAEILDPSTATRLVERGQQVLIALERLPFPTVAAIHGPCLGGGLELALACTQRVCTDDPATRLGFPEVKLGIHPGFGGCVRSPKVVGLMHATEWILAGSTITPRQAKRAGLVAQVVAPEILDLAARRLVPKAKRAKPKGGVVGWALTGNPLGRKVFFDQAEKRLRAKVNPDHYPAPFAALKVLRQTAGMGSAQAHGVEAASCGSLIPLKSTKNLIRVFFASERLKHQDAVKLGKADAAKVRTAVVAGAGIMGGGIAGTLAQRGIVVRLGDLSEKAITLALKGIAKEAARAGKKGAKGEADRIMGRVLPTLDLDRLGRADVLIEAVPERMDVKKSLFENARRQLGDEALLLTNTSSLSVSTMFEDVPNPGRAAGMHFFNPVPRMPLVEVIVGEKTAPETVATVAALAARIGKMPLVVQECAGFLVNRILMPYLTEAVLLLEQGATIGHVDRVLGAFGMPMGAFRLIDEIGIDVCNHVAEVLHAAYGDRMAPAATMHRLLEAGRLGRKTQKGFYLYEDGKAQAEDPATYAFAGERGADGLADEEILDRCLLAMVAEAGRILDEGIVEDAQALDAGMVFGAGFPAFRGGLMRYVEERGVGQVLAVLDKLTERHGERFQPNDWLRRFATG
jgi:3-hydroxyacyl-CoA dehydrogenase / enoyl-CoA hydratase / 3-hydroxybutyryl-CoA epimerase